MLGSLMDAILLVSTPLAGSNFKSAINCKVRGVSNFQLFCAAQSSFCSNLIDRHSAQARKSEREEFPDLSTDQKLRGLWGQEYTMENKDFDRSWT